MDIDFFFIVSDSLQGNVIFGKYPDKGLLGAK